MTELERTLLDSVPALRSRALRRFPPDVADDLVQDVSIAALTAKTSPPTNEVRRWLFGILRYKIADHLRARAANREIPEEVADWSVPRYRKVYHGVA